MIYLLQFDAQHNHLDSLQEFADLKKAEKARLEIELALHRKNISREVVILEAENQAALRKTHSRYFDSPEEVLAAFGRIQEQD